MSEAEVVAGSPASEPVATVAPVTEVIQPEVAPVEGGEVKPAEVAKTFTQEELDAAVGKRLARERRAWEREQAHRAEEANRAAVVASDEPRAEQFSTVEEYAEKLADFKAQRIVQERDNRRMQAEVGAEYSAREEDARGKYDDFEQVAYNPNLRITSAMAETIKTSEVGPDVAYYLGSNPKEADRISRLPPLAQAKEIGRIEAKLISAPPAVKKVSGAPAPISPVTPRSNSAPSYDTTDPRSLKTMSTSEWIEAERRRQVKKAEARAI